MSVRKNFIVVLIVLTVISCISAFASLTVGSADISLARLWEILWSENKSVESSIIMQIRLPRLLLAYLVGASLAASGVVFQGLLSNPLAGPFTLGISSGAAFGAICGLLFGWIVWLIPVGAMTGAAITLVFVFMLSGGRNNLDPRSLILAGIVVSSFFSAGISLMKSLAGDSLSSIVFWIMGSLSARSWSDVYMLLPYFVVAVVLLIIFSRDLDILSLGHQHAHSLGVDVGRSRIVLLIAASALAAAAVSVSGVIGFVGLVIPHLLRMIVGPSHRRLFLLSLFAGGLLLMIADTCARSLSAFADIPVGVITALLGGPFFCYLMYKRKREEAL